ncbi:hypothetical protein [Leptospira alexanderi]|uniref:Uncharacterized protein n=1 Tax=Leptospira alexanderi serovar Manhao 3 str. L 60 TaxID=1049759 RepID=V6I3E2_9LEPT|nr:hypothetical protein [Leptospira alexanderi]EQA64451.1 hypothetical protein LEP1GSC062_0549 [Leptospira alexanderi serovar Manhao 3 str. L 60]
MRTKILSIRSNVMGYGLQKSFGFGRGELRVRRNRCTEAPSSLSWVTYPPVTRFTVSIMEIEHEVETILDLDIVGISINAVYFPDMSAMNYWTFASYTSLADVWVLQYEAAIT